MGTVPIVGSGYKNRVEGRDFCINRLCSGKKGRESAHAA